MILAISSGALMAIIIVASIVFIGLMLLLYFLVILPFKYRKLVSSLEKQFSHCDALLLGQVTQYIHRLEVISRTNLLYLSKYEQFQRRYKSIYNNEDSYAESLLKQLKQLIANKQYKNIKSVIDEAKKAIESLEDCTKSLNHDLYEVIKLEEDCRRSIDHLREVYRHVKQTYYSESTDLEMVSATFTKMFNKIDASFAKFDDLLEGAEYEEINSGVENLNNVLTALGKVLIQLPKLCKITKTDIPEAIVQLQQKYKDTEKENVPLYHLAFKNHIEEWKKKVAEISKRIINLQVAGVKSECELILLEVQQMSEKLDEEVAARDYFRANYDKVYQSVNNVEKMFLRICGIMPKIKDVYLITRQDEEKIESLSESVDELGNSKRFLDGFVHSGTRQPYSLLKNKLDELEANYSIVYKGVTDFENYIDSLKNTAEEAYNLISVYYYQVKEAEKTLEEIDIESLSSLYKEKIEAVYEVLNDIHKEVQSKPINVEEVNNKIVNLKNVANAMFEDIDNKARLAKLAERTLVALNSDRDEQDVNQTVKQFESGFYKGEFQSVYSQANSLYKNRHSDNEAR